MTDRPVPFVVELAAVFAIQSAHSAQAHAHQIAHRSGAVANVQPHHTARPLPAPRSGEG
jgi:hypothetical protein